ncbi:biotin biosynthesis protein BioC [Mesobacillus campisalis]|uniref:Biotin transporter n=1 Tax=Mesobacillus campisalis TaxID=1408103 RepID=A0A0M2SXY7_9BACI|nr:biotin transporter BioY [Mesobacillus campisalis]KKK38571.1 biotin biosynthesis protein BioC [Mesobacillus campisalis]
MKKRLSAFEISLAGMFVAMMAVGANITAIAPFMIVGGVPITLQTFFAILAGAVLGSRLGTISMAVYAFVGLAGAPIFARFGGGISTIVSPTFGFIVSFIIVAFVVGKIVERKQTLSTYIIGSLAGLAINYFFGTNWMYFAYKLWAAAPEGFTYGMAWLWMAAPLPKDIALTIGAAVFAHRFDRSVLSRSQLRNHKRTA